MTPRITSRQIRMARAGVNWTKRELAARAKIAAGTLKRIESVNGPVPARYETLSALMAVLEKAGIEFLGSDGVRYHGR